MPPITPQSYERHVSATKLLENKQQGQFTEQQIKDLEKDQLNDKQLAVLDRMKQYTDFNDLAVKSSLGREGFTHQVKTAVAQVVTKTQASDLSQTHQQSQHRVQKHERRLRLSH